MNTVSRKYSGCQFHFVIFPSLPMVMADGSDLFSSFIFLDPGSLSPRIKWVKPNAEWTKTMCTHKIDRCGMCSYIWIRIWIRIRNIHALIFCELCGLPEYRYTSQLKNHLLCNRNFHCSSCQTDSLSTSLKGSSELLWYCNLDAAVAPAPKSLELIVAGGT